jgi:hypothetical protein
MQAHHAAHASQEQVPFEELQACALETADDRRPCGLDFSLVPTKELGTLIDKYSRLSEEQEKCMKTSYDQLVEMSKIVQQFEKASAKRRSMLLFGDVMSSPDANTNISLQAPAIYSRKKRGSTESHIREN